MVTVIKWSVRALFIGSALGVLGCMGQAVLMGIVETNKSFRAQDLDKMWEPYTYGMGFLFLLITLTVVMQFTEHLKKD